MTVLEDENRAKIEELERRIKDARGKGAMFHPTNPPDAWYCNDCNVFGRGRISCWSCDSKDLMWQYIPRWGGGAQQAQYLIEEGNE